MDSKLKKLITQYLTQNFMLELGLLNDYKILNKIDNVRYSIKTIINDINLIFNVLSIDSTLIFSDWISVESIKLNNKIVDGKYGKYY